MAGRWSGATAGPDASAAASVRAGLWVVNNHSWNNVSSCRPETRSANAWKLWVVLGRPAGAAAHRRMIVKKSALPTSRRKACRVMAPR